MAWEKGIFTVKVHTDDGPQDRTLGGWINGIFAIDPRRYVAGEEFEIGNTEALPIGWIITHIPTGYVIRAWKGDLEGAKSIADDICDVCDWHFTDAKEAVKFQPIIKEIMAEHDELCSAVDFLRPIYIEGC